MKPSFLVLMLTLPMAPNDARCQYLATWYTVDGGGGTSSGTEGVVTYTVSGTIGQPDADNISLCSPDGGLGCVNPTYEVSGGFWVGTTSQQGSGPGCEDEVNCVFRNGFENE